MFKVGVASVYTVDFIKFRKVGDVESKKKYGTVGLKHFFRYRKIMFRQKPVIGNPGDRIQVFVIDPAVFSICAEQGGNRGRNNQCQFVQIGVGHSIGF